MEKYDYNKALHDDIWEWLNNNKEYIKEKEWLFDNPDENDVSEELMSLFWDNDDITGNGSGAYYNSSWKAEEAICHNLSIYREAIDDWGVDKSKMFSPDYIDVTIRCYLLGEEIWKLVESEEFKNYLKEL